MASSEFGKVTYDDPQVADAAGGNGGTGVDAPADVLDENDPRLTSETLEVNLEGDAYAQPAPPPDKRWRAKLTLLQVKDAQNQLHDFVPKMTKDGKAYMATGITATISDPSGKYDGVKVFDQWVGTFHNRDGSTKVSTILSKLKRPSGEPWVTKDSARLTHRDWMKLFVEALAGEPEVGIETAWEYSCMTCGEEAEKKGERRPRSVVGMHRFPPSPKKRGEFDPEMKCAVNPAHGYGRARPRIAAVLYVSEVK